MQPVFPTMASPELMDSARRALGRKAHWHVVEPGHWVRSIGGLDVEEEIARHLWRLFEHAIHYNFHDLERSIQYVEVTCFKRYRGAGCAPHTDIDSIAQKDRRLSTSVCMVAPKGSLGEGAFLPGAWALDPGESVVFRSELTHSIQPTRTERIALIARALGPNGYSSGNYLWPRKGKPKYCQPVTMTRNMALVK